jgi:hypothetical protein
MKNFGVASMSADKLMDFGTMNARQRQETGGAGIAYHEEPTVRDWDGQRFSEHVKVYWTNSYADAVFLAHMLSTKFAGKAYIVFESKMQYISQPGVPKASKFTEQGVVPA